MMTLESFELIWNNANSNSLIDERSSCRGDWPAYRTDDCVDVDRRAIAEDQAQILVRIGSLAVSSSTNHLPSTQLAKALNP